MHWRIQRPDINICHDYWRLLPNGENSAPGLYIVRVPTHYGAKDDVAIQMEKGPSGLFILMGDWDFQKLPIKEKLQIAETETHLRVVAKKNWLTMTPQA